MKDTRARTPWYDLCLDVEHIRGRGFEVRISGLLLELSDPDVDDLPPLLQRSVWGLAVRNASGRRHFPDDFEPYAFTGTQLCAGGAVRIPQGIVGGLWHDEVVARGAWTYDLRLEVVVDNAAPLGSASSGAPVGQLLFEETGELDPFVVAATRVLEPLIGELRSAVATTALQGAVEVDELRNEIERLTEAVRTTDKQRSRRQALIAASLSAIATILLSIISNRLDGLLDLVNWMDLWEAVRRAAHSLGL